MPNYIPKGYHTVTPYLIVNDADKLLEFMKNALGAQEKFCMRGPDNKVHHAEVKVGDSCIMLGEAMRGQPATAATLYLYVQDCDQSYQQAIRAGGQSVEEPQDKFYGDRTAGVKDSAGNCWWFGTHKEDLSDEEIRQRAQTFYAKESQKAA